MNKQIKFYSIKEVCKELDIKYLTLRAKILNGQISAHKIGKMFKIDEMTFNKLKEKYDQYYKVGIDVDQAAKIAGVSSCTILRKLRSGELKGNKLRRSWKILPQDLDFWITSSSQNQ